jgi:nucleotide-binding universal stress UspA family protein
VKLERILCPLDFSEFSARAFDYAQSLARRYHAKLYLEHVVESVFSAYPAYINPEVTEQVVLGLRSHAEEQLREFLNAQKPAEVQIESGVHEGQITDVILRLASERAVDLIVMGTHGRHGLDRWLLGSVTEKVLRKARCPVLAVRRPSHAFVSPRDPVEAVRLHRILFAADFSTYCEPALRYALSLAQEYKAELTLLHVLEEIPLEKDLATVTAEVINQFDSLLPASQRNGCAVKTRVRVGKPYEEIIRTAEEASMDLVILGVRGRNALDLALFGSTTHRVIQQGPCPVLAVHI